MSSLNIVCCRVAYIPFFVNIGKGREVSLKSVSDTKRIVIAIYAKITTELKVNKTER